MYMIRYCLLIVVYFFSSSAFASTGVQSVLNVLNSLKKTLSDVKSSNASTSIDLESGEHIPIGETLFLSTYLKQAYIGELTVIKNERAYFVEFNNFVDIFSLPIKTSSEGATGWFKESTNRFEYNKNTQSVRFDGLTSLLTEQQVMYKSGQLFVDVSLLQQWFDFELATDYIQQSIAVTGKGHFPIEQALAREQQQVLNAASKRVTYHPELKTGYQLATLPLFDLDVRYRKSKSEQTASYTLIGSNELAYLRSEYFLSGESGDFLKESRVAFSRQSREGSILGLNATELLFGDVQPVLYGENATGSLSQGVRLTNVPLLANTSAGRVSLNGVVPEGWDIELYQNGILIEQQLDSLAGVFFFNNIELLYGENIFEIVKYGTEGQIEKSTERFFSDGIQDVGLSTYSVSINRDNKRIFNEQPDAEDAGALRLAGRFEHVFTPYLNAYIGGASFKEEDKSVNEYATGISFNPNGRMLFNLSHQGRSANQYRSELTARFWLSEQRLRLSASEDKAHQHTTNTYKATLSGDLYKQRFKRFSYLTSLELADSGEEHVTRFKNDLNYRFANLTFSNQLDWRWQEQNEYGSGNLNFIANMRRLYTRATIGYDVYPNFKVSSYSLDINRSFNSTLTGKLKFTRALDSDIDNTELGLNFNFDDFILNTAAQYSSEDEWLLSLSSRFSFGFNKLNEEFFGSKQRLANKGTIMVRVFLDENNNGQFDEGESLLENVAVRAVQSYRKANTDKQGVAVLSGVIANRRTDIELIPSSFEDPFMLPSDEGYSITPRAGAIENLDMPVVYSGEIEGFIHHQNGSPIAYTTVQLRNEVNEIVASTFSEFDGYYLFTDLKPGKYDVFLDDKKLESKELGYQTRANVTLSTQGDVISEVNIALKDKQSHTGFIAVIGQFSNLDILKAYWELVKPKWLSLEDVSPFFVKNAENTWLLAVGFSSDDQFSMNRLCLNAKQQLLTCEVQYVDFN